MQLYTLKYIFYFLLIVLLFKTFPMEDILENFLLNATHWIVTSVFKINNVIQSDYLLFENKKLIISKECTGTIPISIFLAAIMAYPSPTKIKFLFIILSLFLLNMLNILRISSLAWILQFHSSYYDIIHNYIFIIVTLLTFFFLYLYYIKSIDYYSK